MVMFVVFVELRAEIEIFRQAEEDQIKKANALTRFCEQNQERRVKGSKVQKHINVTLPCWWNMHL